MNLVVQSNQSLGARRGNLLVMYFLHWSWCIFCIQSIETYLSHLKLNIKFSFMYFRASLSSGEVHERTRFGIISLIGMFLLPPGAFQLRIFLRNAIIVCKVPSPTPTKLLLLRNFTNVCESSKFKLFVRNGIFFIASYCLFGSI